MRELPWTGAYDAAIHLFSSFGYFAQQADDERTLEAIARALRPDGLCLIDTVNIVAILRAFTPTDSFELPDGRLLVDQRQYDPRSGRMHDIWTFAGAERHRLESSMRVYTYPELAAMLRRAGLEPVADWGDFDGREFDLRSFRLQLLARRS
jgi:SAM-dependent methyltransferase